MGPTISLTFNLWNEGCEGAVESILNCQVELLEIEILHDHIVVDVLWITVWSLSEA